MGLSVPNLDLSEWILMLNCLMKAHGAIKGDEHVQLKRDIRELVDLIKDDIAHERARDNI